MMNPPRVLILCTANSARSQMAEGLLRQLAGDRLEVYSAGAKPSSLNPLAVIAMQQRGIDISHHRSKSLTEFLQQSFDYVLTVCDSAAEACPVFPGKATRFHQDFPDPAAITGSDAEKLTAFVQVRDELESWLHEWLKTALPVS